MQTGGSKVSVLSVYAVHTEYPSGTYSELPL